MTLSSDPIDKIETPESISPLLPQLGVLGIEGYLQTIEFIPTLKPQKLSEQFLIVTAGGSSRAYIYDTKATGGGWRYLTLT